MRIVLQNADGSEEVREVAAAVVDFGQWTLELAPEHEPLQLHLHVPSEKTSFAA